MEGESEQVEQIKDLIGFLRASKKEKMGALEIITPYSGTEETRALFATTDVCKELLRLLPEPDADLTVGALKCLINFSQDESYIKQMCELNVAFRINDLLKQHVKQDIKNENLDGEELVNSAKLNLADGVFELVKKDIKVNSQGKIIEEDKTETIIECAFMLLNNLTATTPGQRHALGIEGEAKFKFIIAESIFGMFCYFTKNAIFDFVPNIMANLACLNEGRKFMIDNKYIEAIQTQMVTKYLSQHRRKYLMTWLRNLLFEFEAYEQKFLELNVVNDICKVLIDEQGLVENLPEAWAQQKAKMMKTGESEIDMQNTGHLIDALVLLGKSKPLLRRMHELEVHTLLQLVKLPSDGEWEDVSLRSQVLQIKLATIDQPAENEEEDAAEAQAKEPVEQHEEKPVYALGQVEDEDEPPTLEEQ